MANLILSPGDVETYIGSANVSTVQYTADQYGNLTYSSGGILQYACVVLDVATAKPYDIKAPAAANVMPIGILLDGPAIGPNQAAAIQVRGRAKCRAFAAISVGDALAVGDTSGRVATISMTGGATDTPIVGYALTSSAEIDDFVEVDLRIGSYTTVTA